MRLWESSGGLVWSKVLFMRLAGLKNSHDFWQFEFGFRRWRLRGAKFLDNLFHKEQRTFRDMETRRILVPVLAQSWFNQNVIGHLNVMTPWHEFCQRPRVTRNSSNRNFSESPFRDLYSYRYIFLGSCTEFQLYLCLFRIHIQDETTLVVILAIFLGNRVCIGKRFVCCPLADGTTTTSIPPHVPCVGQPSWHTKQ